jgi:ABC-2 type transport system permease protein
VASRAEILARVAGSRIRAQSQYRLSFGLQMVGSFLLSFLDFIVILVIFQHLRHLAGWSLSEVAFLYGSSYTMFKLSDMLMGNLDKLPLFIRSGNFDQILTRPLGSLAQVLTSDMDIRHLGGAVQGAVVFAFALQHVNVDWSPLRVVVFVAMILSGTIIFCSLFVAANAIAFWTMDAREVANAFTYGGNAFTQYPLHIFGVWLRRLLGYVVPLGFVNFFPSLFLLDKPSPLGTPVVLSFLSPAVAVGTVAAAGLLWRSAVRHYRSTGS